ncbi:MAG TPA: asparaginase, partial [Mycobacteriales bacterium]|nr:asparaginase [Mycobacteriales bacterium]
GVEARPVDGSIGSSWDITPPAMLELGRRVDAELETADGVVVTHGTDTLEETAAMLSFVLRTDAPVVLTGAMRPSLTPGADGPANLRDALLVASSDDARGRGALVVFAGTIHRATSVAKVHSASLTAFQSPNSGPVGYVREGRVSFMSNPLRPRHYEVTRADAVVPLLTAVAGGSPRWVEAALDGADGAVIAGMGLGHAPSSWLPLLGAAVGRGVPVVMASRTGAGPTGGNYAGPGGDEDVRRQGLLSAGYRTPWCARIELICALAAGADPADVFARD